MTHDQAFVEVLQVQRNAALNAAAAAIARANVAEASLAETRKELERVKSELDEISARQQVATQS